MFKIDVDELLGVSISPGRLGIVTVSTRSRSRGTKIGVGLFKENSSEIAERLSNLIYDAR